jgi:hypothetical protein
MSNSTRDDITNLFNNFTHVLKYIVLFILYVFAFNYMYIDSTIPITFILLFFLHISIIGLVKSDYSRLNSYQYSIFNEISLIGPLIYIGPFLCWVMVFIAISLVISMFSRLKLYDNTSEKDDLEKVDGFELSIVKILLILSTIIMGLLYGFIYSGALTNQVNPRLKTFLDLGENSSLISRLIITTLLLASLVVYFLLSNASNLILGLGISFIIVLYFFNFVYSQFKRYFDYVLMALAFLSLCGIVCYLITILYYRTIDYVYVLIPYSVWLLYLFYMVCPYNRFISNTSNTSSIYLYSCLVIILYITSGLMLYYGGCVRKLWG